MTGQAFDARRWRALKARADAPPAKRRDALFLGAVQIGSIEPVLARRMAAASLPIVATASGWRMDSGSDAATDSNTDTQLALIARWLDRGRPHSTWRDEMLAVTDAAGTPHGRIDRSAVRPLGMSTRSVHLVGLAPGGGVWVQQRAFDKATDPGLWDTLVGGLQSADESDAQTLARETWEEAGLRISELQGLRAAGKLVVRRPVTEGYMVEHIEVFIATLAASLVPNNQDGEVACFECLVAQTVLQRIERGEFTLEAGLILAEALASH